MVTRDSSSASALGPSEEQVLVTNRDAKNLVLRSVRLPAILAVGLLLVALTAFGVIAWRGMQHLDPVDRHLKILTRLQQTGLHLEVQLIGSLNGGDLPPATVQQLRREIASIAALDGHLSAETPNRLAAADAALGDSSRDPKESLLFTLRQLRAILADEVRAHGALLAKVRRDMMLEFGVGSAAVVLLCGVGLVTLVAARKRIFRPLATLEHLLSLLAKRDYSFAPTEKVDPIVQPLTASYNHLVKRLMDLEQENARYRKTLEHEIRTVTTALLEQHRSLAQAERLAATGEVAARIAHELRNPLAGMQMALSNIRRECKDRRDVVNRLDLVIDELRRVTGLLNGLLDQSRITPEPAVELPIRKIVDDLLAVVRYQIPPHIKLASDVADDLVCRLPRDRFRQVLLNLILNSAQAIGERSGKVLVQATAADGAMELTLTDDGPGFPQDFLTEGIGAFRSGRPGGTGLGLSIVSRIARNLEGRMELSNVQPHGARVRLVLPCRGAHA